MSRAYIGAFLVAIAGIIFWVFTMPLYDSIMDQREAIAQRTEILKDRGEIISNINALTQEYIKRSADIAHFASIVPAKKSAAEIISSVQALANESGLQLTTISLTGNSSRDNGSYQVQSVDIGLTGTYLSLKSFLLGIEKNIRVIDISSFDANPIAENSLILGIHVKGNAYFLK